MSPSSLRWRRAAFCTARPPSSGLSRIKEDRAMNIETQKQDPWLQKLVGEWNYEAQDLSASDKPAEPVRGIEVVRPLGGSWMLFEGRGDIPGAGTGISLMTLGFDPEKRCFVGTWVGSMMSHLWIYDRGTLDAAKKVLTLESEGPSFTGETKTSKYRDRIEVLDDDRRVVTSEVLGADDKWKPFMIANYRRRR
jgi:hypothetical protein